MKVGLYAVRDAKTGFLTPTADVNNATAMRNFAHAIMNHESLMYTHPTDYQLWYLGDFDTETGILIQPEDKTVPWLVCCATDFRKE